MKKSLSLLLMTLLISISFTNVGAFSFEDAATDEGTTTETTADANTASEVSISNMDVVFNDDSIPADGKSKTVIYIKVTDDKEKPLSDSDVKLEINVEGDNGSIEKTEYKSDTELFEVTYVAGKKEGKVSINITAVSKADKSVKLEQLEDFTLTKYEEPKKEEPKTTNKEDVANILTNLDNAEKTEETKTETKNTETKTETKKEGVNILSSKIIDENRLKITFDRKIFLPDDPLSLISIKKSSDKSVVTIANVTLSEDKKSLIALTSTNLEKVPYLVTVTEVIDGDTKKKVSVVNSELTVTGINDYIFMLLGILLFSGMLFIRRKTK